MKGFVHFVCDPELLAWLPIDSESTCELRHDSACEGSCEMPVNLRKTYLVNATTALPVKFVGADLEFARHWNDEVHRHLMRGAFVGQPWEEYKPRWLPLPRFCLLTIYAQNTQNTQNDHETTALCHETGRFDHASVHFGRFVPRFTTPVLIFTALCPS